MAGTAVKKKAKKQAYKVDVKSWNGQENLLVIDVSAVMRSNFISMHQEFGANFGARREPMTYEVNGEIVNTSAIYGLMRLFQKYKSVETDYIFCFDTPNNMLKAIDKNYKAGRVKMDNEYFDQVNTVYKILQEAGYTVLAKDGFEADHMVVEAVNQNKRLYDNIGVVTNDRDLSHLVGDNTYWLHPLVKESDISFDTYVEALECPYNSILLKKCMVGDKSDKIVGIFRFGEVAFQKFLKEEHLVAEDCEVLRPIRGHEREIILQAETLSDDKKGQALHALDLILPLPVQIDARANREINKLFMVSALKRYGMSSLLTLFQS
ncbi:hypothetical protein CN495_07885 [Bacillus thuringiensis]|uniref:5'-3' exonuclease n=1 Tax=Bacillus thuringiensis TaxID=1428 RepID=A0ABD6SAT8_BACTU|nr:hypothetical protein [Bacillus thuringiensis]KLA07097.1 DNA polymerase I [Bacillus cereus]PER55664.1 hypothetical protein CN495_07885 [Bacillus thuringiensis]